MMDAECVFYLSSCLQRLTYNVSVIDLGEVSLACLKGGR